MHRELIDCVPLGQSGFRFAFGPSVVYVDPYLSDSVEEAEGPELTRLVPIWKPPEDVTDADWVLITHSHLDHCDLASLIPISEASPSSRFVGPQPVVDLLVTAGLDPAQIVNARRSWISLGDELRVHAVTAAHPEIARDADGNPHCVGYCIEYRGRRIYNSGDTSLNATVLADASAFMPIGVAILPINERNYYRESRGIIGNMSVREAIQFAVDLEVDTLVPVHWDMFALNGVSPEEIQGHYDRIQPPFALKLNPERI